MSKIPTWKWYGFYNKLEFEKFCRKLDKKGNWNITICAKKEVKQNEK